MMTITKDKCCGCTACMAICPKQCISMQTDEEGFLYPEVDKTQCIDCGMCERVCQFLHHSPRREPIETVAAKCKDVSMRLASSSGGIFTMLAEAVIGQGGVVFGVRFDENWNAVHDYTETIDGLATFRGSKYMQSDMGDCYVRAKEFLESGRMVLFTGTPCQIRGLKNFLRKDYDNLLAVDVICHGVPSSKVWQKYLKETSGDCNVTSVNFRDKRQGWRKFNISLGVISDKCLNTQEISCPFGENAYMQVFLSDLSLRPSCFGCQAKAGMSGSDLTIGDYWGIGKVLPGFDDDTGASVIIAYTEKGKEWLGKLDYDSRPTSFEAALRNNQAIISSANKPVYRDYFFKRFMKTESFHSALNDTTSTTIVKRLRRLVYRKTGL